MLSDGGLIRTRASGRERINSFDPSGMAPVMDWLTAIDLFWDDRLAALRQAIEEEDTE